MFKKALIAVAAFAAASTFSTPAEAFRDKGRVQVVFSYGSPGYYYQPYYQPVYYRPKYRYSYYYDGPRYRYRPHKRHSKKRHWRQHRRW